MKLHTPNHTPAELSILAVQEMLVMSHILMQDLTKHLLLLCMSMEMSKEQKLYPIYFVTRDRERLAHTITHNLLEACQHFSDEANRNS